MSQGTSLKVDATVQEVGSVSYIPGQGACSGVIIRCMEICSCIYPSHYMYVLLSDNVASVQHTHTHTHSHSLTLI